MHGTLLLAIITGLGGMVGWGASDFFAKKTIDEIGDLRTLFWSQLIGVVPLAAFFFTRSSIPPLNQYDPFFLLVFGIVSALSYLALYNGFGRGEVSLLSPVFASYAAVVAILSALFLHEAMPLPKALAILVVLIGILLLSTDPRDFFNSLSLKGRRIAGVPQVLSAMVVYSVWLVFLDKFLNGKDWLYYLLVIRAVAALTLITYAVFLKERLTIRKHRPSWKYLVLIGLFDVAAFSAVSYGFSATSFPSIVAVLSAAFSLPTIVLAHFFLKEKMTRYQLVSALVVIVGIGFITLT